ncbi:unnamed protein product [Phytophthora fragariaefolia]|uniref:Unnamed protein product n=1 Tax=Phytophthora fragariaefolia TaxID=1490495 RepID=A0A9W6X4D6_9STRA|nr:unnamed protein product [Phytophthora fragariaefolia]
MSLLRSPSLISKTGNEQVNNLEKAEVNSFRVMMTDIESNKSNSEHLQAVGVEERYIVSFESRKKTRQSSSTDSLSSDEEIDAPLSITLNDAILSLQFDEKLIFAGLRLLIALTMFIFIIALLGSERPTHQLFNQSTAVSTVLAPYKNDGPSKTVQFRDIGDVDDVFDWLAHTFVPSVFNKNDQDHRGYLDLRNQVLGGVILERTPLRVGNCSSTEAIIQLQPYCTLPEKTHEKFTFLDIEMNVTEVAAVINKLKRKGLRLNYRTKRLRVIIATYNSDIDTFSVTRMDVNFREDGMVEPRVSTKSVADYREQHMVQSIVVVGIGVLYYVALLVYIDLVKAPSNRRSVWHRKIHGSFAKKLWQIMLTLATVCATFGAVPVFFVVMLKVMTMDIDENIGKLADSNTGHDSFIALREVIAALDNAVIWVDTLSVVGAAAVIQLSMFVIRQLRFHPRLNVFAHTIENSLRQFRDFFVIFIIIFLTFSTAGNSLFGKKVLQFSTASNSMVSCMNMLFQTFDYNSIMAFRGAGVFYWSYMIVVNIVLLNMMLAIVMGVYQAEIQEGYNGDSSRQIMTRIRKNYPYKELLKSLAFWRIREVKQLVPSNDHPARTEPINTDREALECFKELKYDIRKLTRENVIWEGKVYPPILLPVLRGKERYLQQTEAEQERSLPMTTWILTPTTLLEMFPAADLTSEEIRSTFAYLHDGLILDCAMSVHEATNRGKVPKYSVLETARHENDAKALVVKLRDELTELNTRVTGIEQKLDTLLEAVLSSHPNLHG